MSTSSEEELLKLHPVGPPTNIFKPVSCSLSGEGHGWMIQTGVYKTENNNEEEEEEDLFSLLMVLTSLSRAQL